MTTITEGNIRDINAMLPHGGTRRGLMTVCLNYFDDPADGIEKAILAFNEILARIDGTSDIYR